MMAASAVGSPCPAADSSPLTLATLLFFLEALALLEEGDEDDMMLMPG